MSTFSLMAADIVFPEEELPNEAFPPQLDSPQAVIARKISYKNRWEPQISYGWLLDEPFYQSGFLAMGLGYSWSEFSGISLRILSWNKGISEYGNQFSKTNANLQFSRAKGPESGYTLSYNQRLLYGKVSFSKGFVIPTTFSMIYEGGMIKYGSRNLPLAGIGISNSWFVLKKLSFGIGLRLFMRQALDPLSADLKSASPPPAESSFTNTVRVSTSMDLGINYLF